MSTMLISFKQRFHPGVTYSRTEPPAPDHGFSVRLTGAKKLWADASYSNAASTTDALRTETEDRHVEEQHPARLGAAPAAFIPFHCPANMYHEACEERLILTEQRRTGRAPICYWVAMRTALHESNSRDVALFQKLATGFQRNVR